MLKITKIKADNLYKVLVLLDAVSFLLRSSIRSGRSVLFTFVQVFRHSKSTHSEVTEGNEGAREAGNGAAPWPEKGECP